MFGIKGRGIELILDIAKLLPKKNLFYMVKEMKK